MSDLASGEIANLLSQIYTANKDPNLRSKIKRCLDIAKETENFVEESCSPETELQKKIVEDTYNDPKVLRGAVMLSGKVVGQLIKLVAEMVKAKRILEIGMYTGYSAVTAGETTFCVSHEMRQKEEIVSLDFNPYVEGFVKERLKGTPIEKKHRILVGPASESLKTLQNEGHPPFDMVYIDADKSGYINYYKFIMDNELLIPGGVFLCDNILWDNDTVLERRTDGGQALYDFVQFVRKDDRVDQIIFPMRDGVMLIKAKIQ